MILRRQLPTWSMLTLRSLAAGLFPSRNAITRVEQRILHEYGSRFVRLTASGTAALASGFLAATTSKQRPRIGLPAWGCHDLMTAADAVNAEVFLYDLDPVRLAPDSSSLSRVLQESLDALVAVHWFGMPIDLEPIRAQASKAGVLVIDDAAQGTGAFLSGKPVGSLGDLGVLSFGRGKGRIGGNGGALLACSDRGAEVLSRIPHFDEVGSSGYPALWAQWVLGRPSLYWIPSSMPFLHLGETIYKSPPAMRSFSRRSASVLDRVWEDSLREARLRSGRALEWLRILPHRPDIRRIVIPEKGEPGWLRCPVLVTGSFAEYLAANPARKHGVVRGYPRTLAELPVSPGRILNFREEFAGAAELAREVFTLPTHRFVSERDFSMIEGFKK